MLESIAGSEAANPPLRRRRQTSDDLLDDVAVTSRLTTSHTVKALNFERLNNAKIEL